MKQDLLLIDIAGQIKAHRFNTPKAVAQQLGTTEKFVRCQLRAVLAYLGLIEWQRWSQCFFPNQGRGHSKAASAKH